MAITLNFLDLVPIIEGGSMAGALAHAADTARLCESAGYKRYWVAEHHGAGSVGGAATSVVLAHIGAATSKIRIGAGGIMLPNHAPLQIAEQFGTLDALFSGRIDLGLGRAPGSDGYVARALRRTLQSSPDNFPQDVVELQKLFAPTEETIRTMGFRAIPGADALPELWILGSSMFGAQVAAALGLPFAFAAHFSPGALDGAVALYRERFHPSAILAKPYVMVACNAFAAETDAEAHLLASSLEQTFAALWRGEGLTHGVLPPRANFRETLAPHERSMLDETLRFAAICSPATVRKSLAALVRRSGADEVIVTDQFYDPDARFASIAMIAEVAKQIDSERLDA